MDIDNLDLTVLFQVLAQLGNIHIHRTGIEVVVIDPDSLQGKVTLQNLVRVATEQSQQFVLLRGEFRLLLSDTE